MNKSYRSSTDKVSNPVTGAWVAVPEVSTALGKKSSGSVKLAAVTVAIAADLAA